MLAAEIIKALDLRQHPEGGWFTEVWRANAAEGARPVASSIYYLLEAHQVSRWHRIDATELWHWYAGAPMKLMTFEGPGPKLLEAPPEGLVSSVTLGDDLAAGARPQQRVEPGHWQRVETLGEFTLVGCTVSPAFEFERFELAPEGWGL